MGFSEIKCDGRKIDGDLLQLMICDSVQAMIMPPAKIYHQFHENRFISAYDLNNTVRINPKSKVTVEPIDDRSSLKTVSTVIYCNSDNWGLKGVQLPEVVL